MAQVHSPRNGTNLIIKTYDITDDMSVKARSANSSGKLVDTKRIPIKLEKK